MPNLVDKIREHTDVINKLRNLCEKITDIVDGFDERLKYIENAVDITFWKSMGVEDPCSKKLKKKIRVLAADQDMMKDDLEKIMAHLGMRQ
jgi:hypothetical protein